MTLLAMYSPTFSVGLGRYIRSLFIKPCKVLSMGLSTWTIWLYQLPLVIKFTPTNVSCITAGAKHHQKEAGVRERYKLCTKSYIGCRSNFFSDSVVVEWKEESQTLQTKAIKEATVSGKKVGQLNVVGPKFQDKISASTYGGELTL